jgi:hypothetical protein
VTAGAERDSFPQHHLFSSTRRALQESINDISERFEANGMYASLRARGHWVFRGVCFRADTGQSWRPSRLRDPWKPSVQQRAEQRPCRWERACQQLLAVVVTSLLKAVI